MIYNHILHLYNYLEVQSTNPKMKLSKQGWMEEHFHHMQQITTKNRHLYLYQIRLYTDLNATKMSGAIILQKNVLIVKLGETSLKICSAG